MTRITVDPATLSKLAEIQTSAELCDADGNRIGFFHAAGAYMYRYVPDISEVELDRFAQESGGRPLADILRNLEKLP